MKSVQDLVDVLNNSSKTVTQVLKKKDSIYLIQKYRQENEKRVIHIEAKHNLTETEGNMSKKKKVPEQKEQKQKHGRKSMPVYNSKGERFESITEAAKTYSVSFPAIWKVINKENATCRSLKWFTKEHADKTYEAGKPVVSDAVYDKAVGINADTKSLPDKTKWKKVAHTNPMCSLTKIDILAESFSAFESWMPPKTNVICLPKYDGMAIKLNYVNGKLVSAVTRGNGTEGEDILKNIVQADNVKTEIKNKYIQELIGEVIIPKGVFEQNLKDIYSNPRNGATGAAKDFSGKNAKYLSVRYHGVVIDDASIDCEHKKFEILEKLGFEHLDYDICYTPDKVKDYYDHIQENRDKLDFEVDGIVVKINKISKQEKMGVEASGNPKWACALKFPPKQAVTALLDIKWQYGLTGVLTPVAVVEEVDLGVKVTNVSLANLDSMQKLWGADTPRKYDLVTVSRRGDVIPHIEAVTRGKKKGVELVIPDKCPVCKTDTIIVGAFLECSNPLCGGRELGDLIKWSNVLKEHFKVKGLGEERITQMYEAKLIKTPADLYTITTDALIDNLNGVKEKSASNILEFQKYREWPLTVFLDALNIPHIGQSIFTFITEAGHTSLDAIYKLGVSQLSTIPNLGKIRAQVIVSWLKKKRPLIDALLKHIDILDTGAKAEKVSEKLAGLSFCITGTLSKSRPEIEELIVQNGGTIKGVSSKLDYLVVGDKPGSKVDKANKLGVKQISEQKLSKMLK